MKPSLRGVIDMHVHTAPDTIRRKFTDLALTDAAVRCGARAIVIKSHRGSTVERAFLCNEYNRKVHGPNDFTMHGGIVLNEPVGGFNPAAVKVALTLGGKVVWLPTVDAENDRKKMGRSGGLTVLDENGALKESVRTIMALVGERGAVLATGHLSPREIFAVAAEARRMALPHLVITHPEYWVVDLTYEQQRDLAVHYGAILERCCRQPLPDGSWKDNLPDTKRLIDEIGWTSVMTDTDGGQPVNPLWEDEMAQCIAFLRAQGVPEEGIRHMTHTLPARLLGLED